MEALGFWSESFCPMSNLDKETDHVNKCLASLFSSYLTLIYQPSLTLFPGHRHWEDNSIYPSLTDEEPGKEC